ncbi:hypothetical protein E6C60_0328 [Paenibacillus algicola]|uniref:DUF2834 domain-containing protein n=1 Tax=Paenibacillus algicola TaxID=2565926 RepID=A0A4P8XFA6_9BACL|nr:hypothetical protein [Paenibacillus algicola]QCT01052.1 hypothetical protein E6C60_0328 [Paenibacillus algicola]
MLRWSWLALWLAFIVYAAWLAPGQGAGDDPLFKELITLQSKEPSLMALFSMLGLFPIAFACLLLRSDRGTLPAWPFSLAAFGLGAFALIPYYVLQGEERQSSFRKNRAPRWVQGLAGSGWFLWLLIAGTLAVIGWGLTQGSMEAYQAAFQSSQFVHVMSLDFLVLTLLSVYGIYRDDQRKPYPSGISWMGLFPIVGLLLYLWLTRHRSREAA